jgi:hypothetical protein
MTRVNPGTRRCPNCGRDLENLAAAGAAEEPAPLAPARGPRAEGKRKAPPKPAAQRDPEAPLRSLALRPAEVRMLVAASPESIEPGLRVYEEDGREVGVGYRTAVGDIDLLARDDAGGLVVAMVAEGEPDKEAVLELLECIGFVRTQIAEVDQEVRGVMLVQGLSDSTRYAIAAFGGTLLSIKSWRVALTFEDLLV